MERADRSRNIRVLTWNVFDLPLGLSKEREWRIPLILKRLREGFEDRENGWDVVFLQEAWTESFRKQLLSGEYGDWHFNDQVHRAMPDDLRSISASDLVQLVGRGGPFGSGLLTLSRFPLSNTESTDFAENGALLNIGDGEIAVKKGIQAAAAEVPGAGPVWLINTHLVSRYDGQYYERQRRRQWKQLKDYTKNLTERRPEAPTVIAGDFNFGPYQMNPEMNSKSQEKISSSEELYRDLLYWPEFETTRESSSTFCGETNPFIDRHSEGSQKIDHILFSDQLEEVNSSLVFTEQVPVGNGRKVPLSDHYGLASTLRLKSTTFH